MAIQLVTFQAVGPGLPLALGPRLDMVKVTGGESEVGRELNELEEESEGGLRGG